jgi:hypothetical protein
LFLSLHGNVFYNFLDVKGLGGLDGRGLEIGRLSKNAKRFVGVFLDATNCVFKVGGFVLAIMDERFGVLEFEFSGVVDNFANCERRGGANEEDVLDEFNEVFKSIDMSVD